MKDKKWKTPHMAGAEQLVPNKKQPKRIDLHVVKRLIKLLYYNARIKKTKIATKCNLGYDKCVLYLNWLEMMDLIDRETDADGFETIVLSERGNDFYKRNLNDN